MEIKSIGFIGFGLIGGSIGKAVKIKYPKIKLYGHAGHEKTVFDACRAGIIENDRFLSFEELAQTDILFLCSPVMANIQCLKQIKPYLSERTLLTDVGSVKGDIHAIVDELGLSDQFIGGHPMTGSEKIGFAYSDAALLENAYYILTASDAVDPDTLNAFDDFISSLGSITMRMTPKEHDFATAAVSHLPHVISASLVNLIRENEKNDILKTIAAGGFKDITRISSSSPVMWQNICIENKDEILSLIRLYEKELKSFESAIADADKDQLLAKFSSAKDYRDSLPSQKHSLLPEIYELFVDLKDETGVIAKVASLLAENHISIKNIGIVNNREFEEGVLRIELKEAKDLSFTEKVLKENGYPIHLRK